MRFLKDLSFSAVTAGFVTVLVGFTSSVAIIFQAAYALGATAQEISSWMWALGLGMGVTCISLSLYFRKPVVTAWSTPGAALLITSVGGTTMAQAIGAFIFSALLITLSGFTGWFERVMSRLPLSLASAMLAGILLRFGLDTFVAMKTQFMLVFPMFCVYLFMRRWLPRYAVIVALFAGIFTAALQNALHLEGIHLELAKPVFIAPEFSLQALIGIAMPLFIVTMASQNMPGVAAIRASGYITPVSPIIGWTGLVNLVLAPFGAFTLNLAAITAAICMGREAHEDKDKRYVAAVTAGIFYIFIGLVGGAVVAVFAAFPKELVLAIAGLALFGTIGNGLLSALSNEREREPALISFLVTASGFSLFGIGAAFWGLIAGIVTLVVFQTNKEQLRKFLSNFRSTR
jgi:benzoate membrane transport protein